MNDKKSDKAVETFKKGNNCSMAVFSAFALEYGVKEEIALKIAAPFGGGIGRMGETCGAVTGALMALGLAFQTKPDETIDEMKGRLYLVVREFMREFTQCHGSIKCHELVGCDLSTPEGARKFKERDLMNSICVECVCTAVELVEKLGAHVS
jgi:C_GCAxxG_C_C family probable redox protein